MKIINLNEAVLVHITKSGFSELEKKYGRSYVEAFIIKKRQIIDGKPYYAMQGHQMISTFGDLLKVDFSPQPIGMTVLIPDSEVFIENSGRQRIDLSDVSIKQKEI